MSNDPERYYDPTPGQETEVDRLVDTRNISYEEAYYIVGVSSQVAMGAGRAAVTHMLSPRALSATDADTYAKIVKQSGHPNDTPDHGNPYVR